MDTRSGETFSVVPLPFVYIADKLEQGDIGNVKAHPAYYLDVNFLVHKSNLGTFQSHPRTEAKMAEVSLIDHMKDCITVVSPAFNQGPPCGVCQVVQEAQDILEGVILPEEGSAETNAKQLLDDNELFGPFQVHV